MTAVAMSPASMACERCGTEVAATLLSCPQCQRLVHAGRLAALAETAQKAEDEGRHIDALEAWRASADVLPSDSKQHQIVSDRIAALVASEGSSNQPNAKGAKTPRW